MTDTRPSTSPLVPGGRLDRFELLANVAQGGMANVWLARLSGKHGVAKLFAVKTILPQYAGDPQFHAMFVDEARIASRVEHPSVAQIFELGEHSGVLYIVMEWVDGDSIDSLTRALEQAKASVPIGVAIRIAADACAGLHAAHELKGRGGSPLGVVHRDVSPQNLLVTAFGVTKLIDFGVAKARERLSVQTSAGNTRGKLGFMAREQALGQTIDRRTDVWAAAAVLHFLLAGEHPFGGGRAIDTLRRVMNGDAPSKLPATVPPSIASIVARALSHDPAERFDSAEAMRTALLDAAEELRLDTRQEAVAAAIASPLAEARKARALVVERALEEADARNGAPRSSRAITPPASPAHSEPDSKPLATLGSTTIEQPARTPPRRFAWTAIGAASVIAAASASAVILRGRAAPPPLAAQGSTSAPELVVRDATPAPAITPALEPRDAGSSPPAAPPAIERPARRVAWPRPTPSTAPRGANPPAAPAPSASQRRDYGF